MLDAFSSYNYFGGILGHSYSLETANPFSLACKFVMQDQYRVGLGTNFAPTANANVFMSLLPDCSWIRRFSSLDGNCSQPCVSTGDCSPLVLRRVSFLGLGYLPHLPWSVLTRGLLGAGGRGLRHSASIWGSLSVTLLACSLPSCPWRLDFSSVFLTQEDGQALGLLPLSMARKLH